MNKGYDINFILYKKNKYIFNLKFAHFQLKVVAILFLLAIGGNSHLFAQDNPRPDSVKITQTSDSTLNVSLDSALVNKSQKDSTQKEGPIETTIDYNADTVIYDMVNSKAYLYKDAKVTYGEMSIEAYHIVFDMRNNTVSAKGMVDSTGTKLGLPVFTQAGETYNAEEMDYNIESGKGIIKKIVTQQGDGYVVSKRVKKTPANEMYARSNIYTTCAYEEPHYGINTSKLKIVPNKYIISGPFNFELNGVPTPLGFGFGLFPFSEERSAGLIVPTWGESKERGFYLRDGGIFLPLGEYVSLKVLGQIYSLGGWGFSTDADYRVRYKFNGRFNFSYNNVKRQQDNLEVNESTDYWLRWSHSPVSRGSSRFSANVNVGSSSYNRNNSFNTQDYISASFNSSVSYSKTFEGTPFNAGANIRINQNVNTQVTNLFPEANLAMRRIYPLKGKNSTKKNVFTQLSFAYSFNAKASVTNEEQSTSFPFTVLNPIDNSFDIPEEEIEFDDDGNALPPDFFSNFSEFLQNAEFGAVHRIPISTNFTLLKFFQFTPNLNYTEYWYAKKYDYEFSEEENGVYVSEKDGFSRAFDFNTGIGMTTRLYSFFYPKIGKVEGIRHMMTPNISFTYRPDLGDPRWGFYQNVQSDSLASSYRTVTRFQGAQYGIPGQGKSSSLSFGIDNQLEAKVRMKPDSTGKVESKKIPVIQSFSIRSAYNLAVDSFNLSNITMSARTTLFKNVPFISGFSINVAGTIDPYTYELLSVDENTDGSLSISQKRINEFAWNTGNGVGNLTNASLAVSTSFRPDKKKKEEKKNLTEREKQELEFIENNPTLYVDFNIPWSLNLSYNLRYGKVGYNESTVVQTMNIMAEVKLTEKWKIGVRTAYDFELQGFGFTSINLHRDLHCWQMALSWIPFGPRQSYNVDISVKSAILQDLKLSKRNTWFDR